MMTGEWRWGEWEREIEVAGRKLKLKVLGDRISLFRRLAEMRDIEAGRIENDFDRKAGLKLRLGAMPRDELLQMAVEAERHYWQGWQEIDRAEEEAKRVHPDPPITPGPDDGESEEAYAKRRKKWEGECQHQATAREKYIADWDQRQRENLGQTVTKAGLIERIWPRYVLQEAQQAAEMELNFTLLQQVVYTAEGERAFENAAQVRALPPAILTQLIETYWRLDSQQDDTPLASPPIRSSASAT